VSFSAKQVSAKDLAAAKAVADQVEHADATAPEESQKEKEAEKAKLTEKARVGQAQPVGTWNAAEDKAATGKVLPTLPASCKVDVAYVESTIPATKKIGKVFQLTHSGLTFMVSACDEVAPVSQFTLQFYAQDFPAGVVPHAGFGKWGYVRKLHWDDEAHVFYTPSINQRYWDETQHLGSFSADLFNSKFANWVVAYEKTHSHYQLWDVWDRPTLGPSTKVWMSASVCDSFSQAAIDALASFGASLTHEPILRNYAPLVTTVQPTPVDMKDPDQQREVFDYYTALRNMLADTLSQEEAKLQDTVRHAVEKGFAFVHDGDTGVYWRVALKSPEEYADITTSVRHKMMFTWQHEDHTCADGTQNC
jgi:hypothetical protein